MVEITFEEQNKVKRMKRTSIVSETSGTISNVPTFELQGSQKKKRKRKGNEKIFEEIIVENFPNMKKEIVNQVQEVQRVPYRINRKLIRKHKSYMIHQMTWISLISSGHSIQIQKNTSQVYMEHSPGQTTSWVTNQTSVNLRKLKSYQASSLTTTL